MYTPLDSQPSIVPVVTSLGVPHEDLNPVRHLTPDLISAKEIWQRIMHMVIEYDCFLFSAINEANLLYVTDAAGVIPPEVVNTRGAKVPCSISCILS
jgi:hypothetical protein